MDLEDNPAQCTLAYWHRPLFSSGQDRGTQDVKPLWDALYEAGADVVLSGHDHFHERFAPQTPEGQEDPEKGIRQFVVGTGGKTLYPFETTRLNSEVREGKAYGLWRAGCWTRAGAPVTEQSRLLWGNGRDSSPCTRHRLHVPRWPARRSSTWAFASRWSSR